MIVQRLHDEATRPLSAMIVDGHQSSVRQLKAAIKDHPRLAIGCTVRTIASAIDQAAELRPDVVFLDVSVADGEGLTAVAQHFAPERAIVVVADRPDFAFEAFEFGAVDYLLKPIRAERLRATLRRIDRFFVYSNEPQEDAGSGSLFMPLTSADRVPIPSRESTHGKTTDLVPVADVIWVESLQNYSVVQLPGHDRRPIKRTLTEWESLLPGREFVRIGRFHLIQLAKLKTITSPSRNEWLAHFHDVGQPLRLGRAAASKLKGILRGSCPA
jgi:two-component system LytT family response regulator